MAHSLPDLEGRLARLIRSATHLLRADCAFIAVSSLDGLSLLLPTGFSYISASHGLAHPTLMHVEQLLAPWARSRDELGAQSATPPRRVLTSCGAATGCDSFLTVTVGDFGLFFVGRYQKGAFDAEDRAILELAAEGAETALTSALLSASLSASKEEVTALGDVGKQVSALACPPDVLALVCQKAATLLAADAAYVALVSPDGMDFRMDTWYGIRSPRWHEITAKFGRGLGGRVGKLRSGITMGEPAEWQGSLEPAVEELVRTEGIQTVVCVPLMAGDDILGVLYAANRSSVRFTPGQGRLLQALADQAAIALANSRLYEEQRRELEVHDLLSSVLLSDGDYWSVAEALQGLIGNPVALYDRHLNLIAHYPTDLPERLRGEIEQLKDRVRSASGPLEEVVAQLESTRKGVLVPSLREEGLAVSRVIAPAVAGTDLLGYVHFLEVDRAFEPADIRLAERASVLLALHMMRGRVAAEVEQRLRGGLLGDLLSDNTQTVEACVRRSAHLGYDLTGVQVVLVVDIVDFGESMRQRGWDEAKAIDLRRRLFEQVALGLRKAGVQALVDLKSDRVVGIVGCGSGDDGCTRFSARLGEALLERLERHLPDLRIVVGMGMEAQGVDGLRGSYEQALACLGAGGDPAGQRSFVRYQDLGIAAVLREPNIQEHLSRIVRRHLGGLIEYDRERGAELVRTLTSYLDHSCSKVATAEALHVHLSTVKYRLERIAEISGLELEDPDLRLEVHLAARAFVARQSPGPNGVRPGVDLVQPSRGT